MAESQVERPLEHAGILNQVLSYAGAGDYIFYAPISKLWLVCYRAVPAHELKEDNTVERSQDFQVGARLTLRRAVFASAPRVKLAHELGLRFNLDGRDLQIYTGAQACEAALAEAHRLGMALTAHTLNGAAFSGELSKIIWLHLEHKCALHRESGAHGARGGHIEVLRWLKKKGAVFGNDTMITAAFNGHTKACAHLRAERCAWDTTATYIAAMNEHWETVRWLHEHGCPWISDQICPKAAEQGSIENMSYMLQQEAQVAIAQQHSGSDMNAVRHGLLDLSIGQMIWSHGLEQRDVTHHYGKVDKL
eukprot:21281-Heterococcus_DN1.PRE.3